MGLRIRGERFETRAWSGPMRASDAAEIESPRRAPAGRAGDTVALLGAWIAPISATVVATPFVLRRMGTSEYGLFAIVLGLVVSMAALGTSRPLTISTAAGGATGVRRAVTWGVALAVIGSLAVAVLAAVLPLTWLVGTDVDPGHARLVVLAGSFAVFGTALMSTASGRVIGVSRFVAVGSIAAVMGVASSVGYVVFASLGGTAIALVLWNGTVACAGAIFFVRAGRHSGGPSADVESPVAPRAVADPSMWPFVLVQLAGNLAIVIERVGLAASTGLDAVTVFVVPHTMVLTLHAGLVWLTAPLLARAVHLARAGNTEELAALYRRTSRLVMAVALFGGVTLAVTGRGLLELWLDGTPILDSRGVLVLTVYATGLPLVIVAWNFADATGHARENARVGVAWLVLVIIGAVCTRWYGVDATVAARGAMVVTLPVYLRRVERLALGSVRHWSIVSTGRILGASAVVAAGELALWTLLGRGILAAGATFVGGAVIAVALVPGDVRSTALSASGVRR